MLKNLEKLQFDSLTPYKGKPVFSDDYNVFCQYTNGGRLENTMISFYVSNELIIEYIDTFMSIEQLETNDYLLSYLAYFDEGDKAYFLCKSIINDYRVFCSTSEANTFFGFDHIGKVHYIDFNEYPFKVHYIFADFQAFINALKNY
jgi:hypothetical protein